MVDDCRSSALRWLSLSAVALAFACSDKAGPSSDGTGGSAGSSGTLGGTTGNAGGAPSGGTAGSSSGGAAATSGSVATGGSAATGGGGAAGVSGDGAGSGATGGGGAGGSGATAGSGGAGSGAGGAAGSGGMTGKGGSGGTFNAPFFLGADISSVQEGNTTFRDTDGQTKTIFAVLKNHGFNYIRIKAFVDPNAPYGYASTANGCPGMREPFGDKAHVVAYGQQIKAAGMGFLLDFHYSDVWADPGNQIIPDPWRNATSITDLAARLKAYTKDVLTTAVAAGARPDMVQVGNEITPGMLMHVPGSSTDCYGNNPANAPIGGSTSNWNNLATLLTAGIEGVREVDPNILVMLHVENTSNLNGVRSWVDNARQRNVDFDVLGLSCYTAFQGQPSVWQNTFTALATAYPDLKFVIAEYNPNRTQANLMIKNLPNGAGIGTFFWEPTRSGEWGSSMFSFQGNTATANSSDFAEYDTLRPQLGL